MEKSCIIGMYTYVFIREIICERISLCSYILLFGLPPFVFQGYVLLVTEKSLI